MAEKIEQGYGYYTIYARPKRPLNIETDVI